MKNYTITVFSENKPGVLYRISDLFLRRKVNVESLTVSEIEQKGISRFTIVVKAETPDQVDKIVKQLYRIIEVTKVFENTDEDLVYKEVAFIKVSTKNPEQRREVEDLVYLFRAKIPYVGSDFVVVEKTGTEEEINSLYTLLKQFGIKEFTRSGRIAVFKEEKKLDQKTSAVRKDISAIATAIDVSPIKKVQLLANEAGAISLAQGIPSFLTAPHIRDAAKEAIDNDLADKYTPGYGIPELREAIVQKLAKDNKIKADVSQVIVTHGGIEGLMSVFLAIMNPQDEILILTPDYASHITQTRIARHGGRPVFVPLEETEKGWVLDSSKLESSITPHTKVILLTNPCNPTGKVYTEAELKEIARIAIKYNLYIITDEIYEYFTFDKTKHISIGSFPEVQDRTISIFGVSKSYSMTGWRIGYVVANKYLANNIFKIHDSLVTCPTAVSQYAALAAIKGSKKVVEEYAEAYMRRRQIVIDELSKTDKLSVTVPQGAYYIFPKFKKDIDDYELSVNLIRDAKVAVIPGSAFGLGGENHVRISFGGEDYTVREGVKRFVTYVNENL